MSPVQWQQFERWARVRLPLLRAPLRRLAIARLCKAASNQALNALLDYLNEEDLHPGSHARILKALAKADDPAIIQRIVQVWEETRVQELESTIVDKAWIPQPPPLRTHIRCALLVGDRVRLAQETEELMDELVAAIDDPHPTIEARAKEWLADLTERHSVDYLCECWNKRRDEHLKAIIVQAQYIAESPPATRVLSQLVAGQHEALLNEAEDLMPSLLAAGRDFDPEIATKAQQLLTELKSAPAQEALCRTAIQQNDPTAFEIARQCGYLPEDPAWKALYYFITDAWDAYQAIDFDQRYLQSLYPHLTDEAKRVLIAKIREAGRGDWIRVISNGRKQLALKELNEEEFDLAIQLAREAERWEDMWWLAQNATIQQGQRILRELTASDWRPTRPDEAEAFDALRDLASRCPDAPNALSPRLECHTHFIGHEHYVTAFHLLNEGSTLLSASNDQTVRIWDVASGNCRHQWKAHDEWISTLATTRDQSLAITACHGGAIKVWTLPRGRQRAAKKVHQKAISSLAVPSHDHWVLSGGADGWARISDLPKLNPVSGMQHDHPITAVAVDPRGRSVASADESGALRTWNPATGASIKGLEGHPQIINGIAFSPDGSLLASVSNDRTAALWDVDSGKLKALCQGHERDVVSLAFSPDGRILATGGWDFTIRLWSVADGTLTKTFGATDYLEGHSSPITCLAFDPSGRYLASGATDNTVCLWDLESRSLLAVKDDHRKRVSAVAFDPAGHQFASASWDNTLRVWQSKVYRLSRLPVASLDPEDFEWIQETTLHQRNSPEDQVWLAYMLRLTQWRRRYDIQLDDRPPTMNLGEFDIELELEFEG